MSKVISETPYTKSVKALIKKVHDATHIKDSIYEEATLYFEQAAVIQEEMTTLQTSVKAVQQEIADKGEDKKRDAQLLRCQQELKTFRKEMDDQRLVRLANVKGVCQEILDFCRGKDRDESKMKVAKLLGTIFLLAPQGHRALAPYNQQAKHLYKAVLCLQLLDQMVADKLISNQYILDRVEKDSKDAECSIYDQDVRIPLLMSALLQDVGNYHPDALRILKGKDGEQNEFRALENEDRIELLKINYKEGLHYLTYGLGMDKYVGGSKKERDAFNATEKDKLKFIRILLKSAIKPEQGVGNLLKVPQIYTSVIMSTKDNFAYSTLPRVYALLNKGAERGGHSQAVVDSLLKITGTFPQGYGVTYIPQDSDGADLDRYEYAIVNGLYPRDPDTPTCRMATKSLTFFSAGHNVRIGKNNNLYFPAARKKLEKISEERLKEILSKLWSNYEQRQEEIDLVPRCWHPHEYFSYTKFQNMWNQAKAITI